MFKRMEKNGKLLGHQLRTNRSLCFFGSKNLPLDEVHALFPQFQFRSLKQVHGQRVVQASSEILEADGHWTAKHEEALLIQTADCVPILIEGLNEIQALHAGWRGVELGILKVALKRFNEAELKALKIFAGPHISKDHFEVGRDVAMRLLESDPLRDPQSVINHPDPEKAYVDLDRVLQNQAHSFSADLKIHFLDIDTFVSEDHPSYRRDGKGAGRFYSFIVRLDKTT